MEQLLTPLPPRRISTDRISIIRREYSYSDIVNKEIKSENIEYITICKSDLVHNLDTLFDIISQNKDIQIKFLDWDSIIYVDKNLKTNIENSCFIVDDGLRVSRDYIDLTKLKHINLTIPLNYLMWGVKFESTINTYCFGVQNPQSNYINYTSINGNENFAKHQLEALEKKIIELKNHTQLNEQEKVLLISDYIQSRTQFIEARESESSRGIFVTPDFPEYNVQRKQSGLVENVFIKQNGVCMGIANLSTLLLNNPEFNVEVESVSGCSHVWNRVLIDGKYYYFDNTWNITRSDDPCEDGLITLSFSNKYNFFGNKTALNIGHHIPASTPVYTNGVLSEEDYKNIEYESKFEYYKKPIYKSYKKK